MSAELHPWVRVANFGVGWEADLAVARLDAELIPARSVGNDLVGIFGPGFQGASARGFFVEVPAPYAPQARAVLTRPPRRIADDEAEHESHDEHDRENDRGNDRGNDRKHNRENDRSDA